MVAVGSGDDSVFDFWGTFMLGSCNHGEPMEKVLYLFLLSRGPRTSRP